MSHLKTMKITTLVSLLSIALTGCLLGGEKLPYSSTKFTPDSDINSFNMTGGMADAWGTWVMFFKGTVNGVEYNKNLDLIENCKFSMKIILKDKVFSYDINEKAKENFPFFETEKCVLHYAKELNKVLAPIIAEKKKNKATYDG